MNGKAVRQNPELFREYLKKIVDNVFKENKEPIESDVSGDVVWNLDAVFKEKMYNKIDIMWESQDLENKFKYLAILERASDANKIAWRPTIGKIPLNNLKGKYLSDLVERLQYKKKKLNELNEQLFKETAVDNQIFNNALETMKEVNKKISIVDKEIDVIKEKSLNLDF